MKLPFLNRKRYIVLKCYTTHAGVHRYAPITMNFKDKMAMPKEAFKDVNARYFDSCWSRIKNRTFAATIPSPLTINVTSDGEKCSYNFSDNQITTMLVDFVHNLDPWWQSKDFSVAKLVMPWRIEEETGTNFIIARHISNRTLMNVLSGVTEFKNNNSINLFNLTAKTPHQYEIPYNTPIVSIYPMSELPLHVESYCDIEKFAQLSEMQYRRFNRSNQLKTETRATKNV